MAAPAESAGIAFEEIPAAVALEEFIPEAFLQLLNSVKVLTVRPPSSPLRYHGPNYLSGRSPVAQAQIKKSRILCAVPVRNGGGKEIKNTIAISLVDLLADDRFRGIAKQR